MISGNRLYMLIAMFVALIIFQISDANSARLDDKEVTRICKHYKDKPEFNNPEHKNFYGPWKRDCTILAAITRIESNYNSKAFNKEKTGSYGLAQLQCATAMLVGLKFDCDQLYDPYINIRFAMRYIVALDKDPRIKNIKDLFASWNAGRVYICDKVRYQKNSKGRWRLMCYPGEYVNYEYVDKVFRYYKYLRRIRDAPYQGILVRPQERNKESTEI